MKKRRKTAKAKQSANIRTALEAGREADALGQATRTFGPNSAKEQMARSLGELSREEETRRKTAVKRRADIDYWRGYGIEPKIENGKVWIPDWAEDLELAICRGQAFVINDRYIGAEALLKYLAEHHSDAAIAVHSAAGVKGLVRFAAETRAFDVEIPCDPPDACKTDESACLVHQAGIE